MPKKHQLLNEEEKKHYVKTFRRRIRIQPSLLQTIPVKTQRDIGNLNDSSFDPKNKFKVRLTSSKTGRKIDLNIKFVKNKFKKDAPPEGAKKLIDLFPTKKEESKAPPPPPVQIQPNQISTNIDTVPEKKSICQPIQKENWKGQKFGKFEQNSIFFSVFG